MYISQQIKQGNRGKYECCYKHAPECQYPADSHGTVATHIGHTHMGICIGYHYCTKRLSSGHTWVDHFKIHHPKITGDDHYGPPPDLAGVKLGEDDASEIQ